LPKKDCWCTKTIMIEKIKAARSFFLIISLLALLGVSCGNDPTPPKTRDVSRHPDTFTFFEVGKNSILSRDLRKELSNALGDEAVEQRTVIDLEINYKGFLKTHFPDIEKLNQELNFPPGERVEHRTIKLMYRYAQKKNVPFDYVEIIFSEFTQGPLLIRVRFKKDDSNTVEALKEKYGPPKTIQWNHESAASLYWRKNSDLLILSIIPDRFGNPTYQIAIYFTQELEELLKAERIEKEKTRKERTASGKTAF